MEPESQMLSISDVEFANIAQSLPKLFSRNRGKRIVNEFELVIREIVGSKHEDDIILDFENCLPKERKDLRNDFVRIKKEIQTNIRLKEKWSSGLDANRTFISSEKYKTLVVSVPRPAKNER